ARQIVHRRYFPRISLIRIFTIFEFTNYDSMSARRFGRITPKSPEGDFSNSPLGVGGKQGKLH
ncbi:MAG TPA: hypothetical protein PKO30_06310, partial [Prolixibacteraceae bacterium]|nr:hypothetical protein [Prolixibacteraceae bacterium]